MVKLINKIWLAADHLLYGVLEGFVHEGAVGEITFSLFGFLGENVAVIGVVSFHLAGAGERESLLRCGFGFHFWHC